MGKQVIIDFPREETIAVNGQPMTFKVTHKTTRFTYNLAEFAGETKTGADDIAEQERQAEESTPVQLSFDGFAKSK